MNNTTILKLLHPHPRDARIVKQDSPHCYYIDGSRDGVISVTTILHSLFPPFDADEVITGMRESEKWPRSPYFGKPNTEIKAIWKRNSEEGTEMHDNIERYFNGLKHNFSTREFEMFLDWRRSKPYLLPYRAEWPVFSKDLKLGGTIDMVLRDMRYPDEEILVLYDWKRCGTIYFHGFSKCHIGNPNLKPLSHSRDLKTFPRFHDIDKCRKFGTSTISQHLESCNFIQHSFQLYIYKRLLETCYSKKVSEPHVLYLHPEQTTFLDLVARDLQEETKNLFLHIKTSL